MKKILLIVCVFSLFSSCKKERSGVPGPGPGPMPTQVDDVRTVLLKTVVEQGLPDPYYKFVYNTEKYVTEINFADGFSIYTVEYDNKRVKKMTNIQNSNYLLYNYDRGQVTRIDEFDSADKKVMDYELEYNIAGKLVQLIRKEYFHSTTGIIYQKQKLAYQPDGNLASIEQFALNNGVLELQVTHQFSDYDDKPNVDDFYMIDNFFDSFLFLPQVKLQVNNPRKEIIFNTINRWEASYSYQFTNNLPVTKIIDVVQTMGGTPGQTTFHFTNQFTYYR